MWVWESRNRLMNLFAVLTFLLYCFPPTCVYNLDEEDEWIDFIKI